MPPKDKFKMPTANQLLAKKRIHGPKKDPVWVYLEREMREKENVKRYNKKVGKWLEYLKDLKKFYHCEAQKAKKRIYKAIGPRWYTELSLDQRKILQNISSCIHRDTILEKPDTVLKALHNLGINMKIPKKVLLETMNASNEDTGVFLWDLFTRLYAHPPCDERDSYDVDSRLLMSSIFYIDLKECYEHLEDLTGPSKKAQKPEIKIKNKPNGVYDTSKKFGVYLQTMNAPKGVTRNYGRASKPPPFEYKVKLRSPESLENLRKDLGFLELRRKRMIKKKIQKPPCNYKFWEPPCAFRTSSPKDREYMELMKMFKMKAKPKRTPFGIENCQFQLQTVSYTLNSQPVFLVDKVCVLPSDYLAINGGEVEVPGTGERITHVLGFYRKPEAAIPKCSDTCDCVQKWSKPVLNRMKTMNCKCGHYYDFEFHNREGKPKEIIFHPPNKHGPFWIDENRAYRTSSTELFIKEQVEEALRSKPPTPTESHPTISATGLKPKELLNVFFTDLTESPLIIPHLPNVNLVEKLQSWCEKKVFGRGPQFNRKKLIAKEQRKWAAIDNMDFKSCCYRIPFTYEEIKHMTFDQRKLMQHLYNTLVRDFIRRNQLKQLEQSRALWPTMKCKSKNNSFVDTYFAYMPSRLKDTFLLNPYSNSTAKLKLAKPCVRKN